jgi:hypothetical protein
MIDGDPGVPRYQGFSTHVQETSLSMIKTAGFTAVLSICVQVCGGGLSTHLDKNLE